MKRYVFRIAGRGEKNPPNLIFPTQTGMKCISTGLRASGHLRNSGIVAVFFLLIALCTLFLIKPNEAFAVGSDGIWVQVPNMLNSHCLGGTILLDNGKVLVTTGYDGSSLTPTSELYDPLSQTWTSTGNVNQTRQSWNQPIVKLNDGRAMLVGGADANVTSLASVEIYDPNSGTWSYTGSLNIPRRQPAVIKLQNGKVLVAAGANGVPDGNRFLASSEIYDPATGQWTYSGNMHVAREVGNFVMLHDGRVMVAGGEGPWYTPGNTAEIYDPNTGQWTLTATMPYGWSGKASMTVLNDGRVLVTGGFDSNAEYSTAMLYDPAANTWTYTGSMHYPHDNNAALLSDGKVLVMGATFLGSVNSKSAEVYDPSTGQWTLVGDMYQEFNTPNGVVILPNGDILVAGACTGTAEIFTGGSETCSNNGNLCIQVRVDPVLGCLMDDGTTFKPEFWNDTETNQGMTQFKNNCYNYATNKATGTFAQPGHEGVSIPYSEVICPGIEMRAQKDGLTLPRGVAASSSKSCDYACDPGTRKLALVVDLGSSFFGVPQRNPDYHWYRKNDGDGTWSHKPGGGAVTIYDASYNRITDPRTANRDSRSIGGQNYTEFCTCFCTRPTCDETIE